MQLTGLGAELATMRRRYDFCGDSTGNSSAGNLWPECGDGIASFEALLGVQCLSTTMSFFRMQ